MTSACGPGSSRGLGRRDCNSPGRTSAMYGTVARMRLKPGSEEKLMADMQQYQSINIPGYISSTVYKLDAGGNEYILAVVFADKDSYDKNSDDPEQDKRFQQMMTWLAAEPQWMDGEIIYNYES
ncbi:MAG TPA: antibiotic biosynthesis monooxygenase [Dehalococcoidia bacterium]